MCEKGWENRRKLKHLWELTFHNYVALLLQYKFEYGLDVFDKYETNAETERKTVVVPAGKTHEIKVEVKDGSTLHWAFKTDQYDIGFEVVADDDDHPEVDYCRCDAYLFDLKGKLHAKPGKCK